MCRPLLTTDQSVNPNMAFNVDFQYDAPLSTQSTQPQVGGRWDEALWDSSNWGGEITSQSNWTSVTGLGYCASIRMVVDIDPPNVRQDSIWGAAIWGENLWGGLPTGSAFTLQVNGFDLVMEKGAFVLWSSSVMTRRLPNGSERELGSRLLLRLWPLGLWTETGR